MRQFWELYVRSVADTEAFYTRALGLRVARRIPDFVVLQSGDVKIHVCPLKDLPVPLRNGSETGPIGARTEFCIEVEDIADAYERARSSGFSIHEELKRQDWGKTDFRMIDPDGAYVRVTTPRNAPNIFDAEQPATGISRESVYAIAEQHRVTALLLAAHECGLFELTKSTMTLAEVSKAKSWVDWKAQILLDALAAVGLLVKPAAGAYRNSSAAEEMLAVGGSGYFGDFLRVMWRQWDVWRDINAIMSVNAERASQQDLAGIRDPSFSVTFQRAMSQVCDDNIEAHLKLSDWQRAGVVIDLAGGHGRHLITLLQNNSHLRGEVWDLEAVRMFAEAQISTAGLADRLSFHACDLLTLSADDSGRADVVMLNHCLHHFTSQQVVSIVGAATGLLHPAGTIIVTESFLDESGVAPTSAALFSYYLMINNACGGLHKAKFLVETISRLGFAVDVTRIGHQAEEILIIGRRPSAPHS